jgi:uncharacterized membrane protein YjjP (DUF1212 family)
MASERHSAPEALPPGGAAEALGFLSDLAAALHERYMPSDLVAQRVVAAARGLGVELEVFALQSAALLQPAGRDGAGAHLARMKLSPHWDLSGLHQLVRLSERIAGAELALPAARAELDRILAAHHRYDKAVALLGWAAFGAAVAVKIGGGPIEALAAGLIGLVTGVIQFGKVLGAELSLQKGFLAALVGTLAAFVLELVLPPFDAGRAVFSAMTLLVPSMTVTLAAFELANERAAEAGVVRLVYGLLRFVMLGAGALGAVHLWGLVGAATPTPGAPVALPLPIIAVAVAIGGLGLAACMRARAADAPWIVAAVLLAWGAQSATKVVLGGQGSPFVSAFVVAVAGSLYGRLPHKVTATFVFPALAQLVPGFLGTQAVLSALRPGGAADRATSFDLLLHIAQLGLGLLVGTAVMRRRRAPAATAGASMN